MSDTWMDAYLRGKPGAVKEYKEEWECFRYLLGDKMFAMHGADKYGNAILTLKLEPNHGALLREQYEDIVPGYYMNKDHWNSVRLDGQVPADVVKDMIDESHRLILASLPKKQQQALLEQEKPA